MADLSIQDVLDMQQELQAKYSEKWGEPICPALGKNKLLWMIGEAGEVIDVMKHKGDEAIMNDAAARKHFIEEMADVLMYYGDVMNCYSVTADELQSVFVEKFKTNMNRW